MSYVLCSSSQKNTQHYQMPVRSSSRVCSRQVSLATKPYSKFTNYAAMRSLALKTESKRENDLAASDLQAHTPRLDIKDLPTFVSPGFLHPPSPVSFTKTMRTGFHGRLSASLKVPGQSRMSFFFFACCQTHEVIHYEDRGCDSKDIALVI